jgi:imidazolonepropionase-like amidohydrolase
MRKLPLLLLLIISCTARTQTPATIIYINNVSVINVITSKIDPGQSIIIENDRITAVGASKKIKAPANATIIDGTGKYAMPGLTDAHIHFFQSGGLYTRPDGLNLNKVYPYEKDQQWIKDNRSDLMARYLACGITTVIDVGGPMSNYTIREQVNKDIHAPNALVTGPLISTYQPPNLDKNDPPIIKVDKEQEARELVKKQLPFKPDFIKIWYIVLPGQKAAATLPIVQAAIEESHANGLKVAVHATEHETALLAVKAGADILVHSVDDQLLSDDMLQLLKEKKIAYIPTLIVAQNYSRTFTQQFNFTAHDFVYTNPFMLGTLMDIQHMEKNNLPFDYKKIRSRLSVPSKEDSIMLANVKKAQQAGVLIVSGTDAGNIGTQHAASLFDEMRAMQQAGLSNWEIIRATTINAAKGFGKETGSGSIEKGKIADILLVEKDPTQDIDIPAHLQTVIHRGVPLQPQQLIKITPEILAQQQLNAYNARNIDAFLAPYSDTVVICSFNGRVMMKGKEDMRKQYSSMFSKLPELHCQLINRMVQGNTVIDHERITGAGDKPFEGIAVYTIEKDKIVRVDFIQ